MRSQFPRLPILIVSGMDDPRVIREALSYGISGFVSKSAKKAELARAVTTVIAGSVYLPDWYERTAPAAGSLENAELVSRLASLTPQQMRVLQMLRQGKLNKQIAAELGEQVTVAKLNIEDSPDTPSRYGVRGIPTMMLFKDGQMTAMKVGAMPKQKIVDWLSESGIG